MKKLFLTSIVMAFAMLLCNEIVAQQQAKSKQKVDPTKWTVIKQDGKYGFIDEKGKVVIEPTFDYVDGFSKEGVTNAKIDGKWGLIDKTGKWKVNPTFQWLAHCDDNLWWAQKDGKKGFIDKTGKWTERQESRYSVDRSYSKFSDGLAPVKSNDLWGYVDKTGKIVIEPQFKPDPQSFDHGVCVVKVEGNKYGIIDKTGKWIVEAKYPSIGYFCEDVVCVATPEGKVGFMDRAGKWVIEPKFDLRIGNKSGALSRFEEGIASVLSNGKFGIIDKTGNWVVEPQFEEQAFFYDGYSTIEKNGKKGVIDKKGNWVIQPKYCGGYNYSAAKNQFVVYNCNDNRITGKGVVDITDKVIIPLAYLFVEYNGTLYECVDYDMKMVYYYNTNGEIVYSKAYE